MFGSHFESSGDVAGDELSAIGLGHEVVAYAAADEGFFDIGQMVDGAVDIEQGCEVLVEVGTDGRLEAAGAGALLAETGVLAMHGVHIGGGSTEVAKVTFPVGEVFEAGDLSYDVVFGAGGNLFTLVGRDGAEGAAAKAATVEADGEADHLVGRDGFVVVFRVWLILEGEVVDGIELFRSLGRIRGIDDDLVLDDCFRMNFIGLYLGEAEVLGVDEAGGTFLLVTSEDDSSLLGGSPHRGTSGDVGGLGDGGGGGVMGGVPVGYIDDGPFSHTIDQQVGLGGDEDRGHKGVRPVIVVGEASHTGFDATDNDGDIGEMLAEDT